MFQKHEQCLETLKIVREANAVGTCTGNDKGSEYLFTKVHT
jgi:hypothetical protein